MRRIITYDAIKSDANVINRKKKPQKFNESKISKNSFGPFIQLKNMVSFVYKEPYIPESCNTNKYSCITAKLFTYRKIHEREFPVYNDYILIDKHTGGTEWQKIINDRRVFESQAFRQENMISKTGLDSIVYNNTMIYRLFFDGSKPIIRQENYNYNNTQYYYQFNSMERTFNRVIDFLRKGFVMYMNYYETGLDKTDTMPKNYLPKKQDVVDDKLFMSFKNLIELEGNVENPVFIKQFGTKEYKNIVDLAGDDKRKFYTYDYGTMYEFNKKTNLYIMDLSY